MKKATRFLVSLMLLLLIIASIIWYLFIYDRAFTRDTLLSQARYQAINGNSRLSSWFYDCAYNFSGHDENVAIELANQYKKTGNYTKAELTLTTSIRDNPTVELYTALSEVFVEQDKLLDAVSLLEQIPEGSIRQEIENQRPSAPQADQEPGFFSQYIDVHLTTDGDAIFYTTDGDYPSMAGDRYSSGITLPAGETKIRAIAVKENGLVSRVADLDYTVTGVIEKAEFQDAAMEAAIRELIHTSATTTVYTDALWVITEFTVPEGTKDFSDLAYLPNLTSLTINGLEIPSLECLTPLSKLVVLDLTGSSFPVDDLKILGTLPSLSSLTMAECSLSTLAGLENAKNLTLLDLRGNTLKKLEPHADNNQITVLDGVEALTGLTTLDVSYNKLVSVDVLSGLTELTELGIGSNTITDISALKTLTKLQSFDFSSNQVAALPEWPEGCALQTIDGSYNALTNIDGLKNMQSLTHVYMDYNLITNIDALKDCYCLVQVNVFGNVIKDVSALRDKDIIVNYDPTAA